ncbi:hypothetical protein SARC_04414 [Sphaeroforma arctica JP610]|uniref:C2H2-type domain-containing protein n=1 Tax=Sphaeroforma arctica JP610 TaxID=667725 RepID=A0A0L0G4X1_9EUKA|nr:hypothetical protein SARC_04414 [Sphaeroforma arctica JP610]KNC83318.1 hypothetical protein SARC_04414 [Sphaeroforma arctica JP610]|eukprot:XP_014157220.1 hypothetical protein SARC_04414 [Sphaeroforma arctica JP610]
MKLLHRFSTRRRSAPTKNALADSPSLPLDYLNFLDTLNSYTPRWKRISVFSRTNNHLSFACLACDTPSHHSSLAALQDHVKRTHDIIIVCMRGNKQRCRCDECDLEVDSLSLLELHIELRHAIDEENGSSISENEAVDLTKEIWYKVENEDQSVKKESVVKPCMECRSIIDMFKATGLKEGDEGTSRFQATFQSHLRLDHGVTVFG